MNKPPSRIEAMFPWFTKNHEAFVIVVAMSIVSGLAQYAMKMRTGTHFSILALVGEITVSASAASICAALMIDHMPIGVTVGCAGVAGHMGARFIGLLDNVLTNKAKALIDTAGDKK